MGKEDLLEARRYAWDYFALHADQRMKMFNFFLIYSGIILAAFPALLRLAPANDLVAFFPLLLPVASFLFWRLDRRTRDLIHNAEAALKFVEREIDPKVGEELPPMSLFTRDEYALQQARMKWRFMVIPITYRESFRLAHLLFAAIGVALTIVTLIR